MSDSSTRNDRAMVDGRRQVLRGLVALVVGCVVAYVLVRAGANTFSSLGFVIAVVGLILIGNGLVLQRRGGLRGGDDPGGSDGTAIAALVLAFVLPPAGVLLATYTPQRSGRGHALGTAAVAIGAILTVVYTFLLVLGAAQESSSG